MDQAIVCHRALRELADNSVTFSSFNGIFVKSLRVKIIKA